MDDQPANAALLPAGLRDLLPPEAETEAAGVAAAMAVFASHAYRAVKPPLLEFEDGFLRGSGAAVGEQSFRIMDPDSHRMMVLRADITPQIARIAATRLAGAPRPLRLSYAGQCLRVRPASPGTDRQVPQAGIELIGADSAAADAEVMLVAAEAVAALGLPQLSFDLTLPTLVPSLLDDAGFSAADRHALSIALDRKDAAEVTRFGGTLARMLTDLLLIAGPAAPALAALRRASLPAACRALAQRLEDVVTRVAHAAPDLRLTIDPLEFRGYRYHTGLAFSMFAPGCPEEIGRGGRYISGGDEPATGVTLYADAVLRAAGPRAERRTIFIPANAPAGSAAHLRADGFATLAALAEMADDRREAARLGCSHVLLHGTPQVIEEKEDVLF